MIIELRGFKFDVSGNVHRRGSSYMVDELEIFLGKANVTQELDELDYESISEEYVQANLENSMEITRDEECA